MIKKVGMYVHYPLIWGRFRYLNIFYNYMMQNNMSWNFEIKAIITYFLKHINSY